MYKDNVTQIKGKKNRTVSLYRSSMSPTGAY